MTKGKEVNHREHIPEKAMTTLEEKSADIIRYTQETQVSKTGIWFHSGISDHNGEDSLFSNQKNSTITITPHGMNPGIYQIYVFKVMHAFSTRQRYLIYHNGKTDQTDSIDFSTGSAEWVSLGNFDFSGNGKEFIRLVTAEHGVNYRFGSVAFVPLLLDPAVENPMPEPPPALPLPFLAPQPKREPLTEPLSLSALAAAKAPESFKKASLRLKKKITIAHDDPYGCILHKQSDWRLIDDIIKPQYMLATTTRGAFIEYRPEGQQQAYVVKISLFRYANAKMDDQARLDVIFDGKLHTQTVNLNTETEGWQEIGFYPFSGTGAEGVRLTRVREGTHLPTAACPIRFDYYEDTHTRMADHTTPAPGYSQYGAVTDTPLAGYRDLSQIAATRQKGAYVIWNPSGLQKGDHTVYARLAPGLPDADPKVRYEIYHNGKVDEIYINQGEQLSYASEVDQFYWHKIGTFDFSGCGNEFVKLTKVSEQGVAYIDSLKFQQVFFDGTLIHAAIVTNRGYTGEPLTQPEMSVMEKGRISSLPYGLCPMHTLRGMGTGISTSYNREMTLNHTPGEPLSDSCFTWNPGITEPGVYRVWLYTHFTIQKDALIEIHHDNQKHSVTLKKHRLAPDGQQTAVFPWSDLGSYYFAGGKTEEYLVLKGCDRFNFICFEKDMGNNGIIRQITATSHPYFPQTKMRDLDAHPFQEDITCLETRGFLSPQKDGCFYPDRFITLEEFCRILGNILSPISTGYPIDFYAGFPELRNRSPRLYDGFPMLYREAMAQDTLSMVFALCLLSNGLDHSGRYLNVQNFFEDAEKSLPNPSAWKDEAPSILGEISRVVKLGVLEGFSEDMISPRQPLTRGAAARLLRNFHDIAVCSGPPLEEDWELTMGDEFLEPNLDWSRWTPECGIRFDDLSSRWPENAVVKDGKLYLYNYCDNRRTPYSSASITMKQRQMHGFFEARYKYPHCYGAHSSFWSSGRYNGRFHGDFNYNEGTFPSLISNNNYFLNYNAMVPLITDKTQMVAAQARDWFAGVSLSKEFHNYSGYVYPEFIAYGFDGKWSHKVEDFQEYYVNKGREDACTIDAPYDFILSTIVTSFDGPLDKDNIDNSAMIVDWIRIYQKKKFAPQVRGILPDILTDTTDIPVIAFDKQIDLNTVTKDKIIIDSHAPDFRILPVTPAKIGIIFAEPLKRQTVYQITVKAGIRDRAGNAIKQDIALTIRTA